MRALLLLTALTMSAQTRQLAITIDDLPRGGDGAAGTMAMTVKLTQALQGIPVAAFVNPNTREMAESELAAILDLWRRQGAELGNHTFSHPDLNKTPLAEYQTDIIKAEPAIRRARGGTPSRYFRHPFLHTGPTEETKQALAQFLKEQRLIPAPVTFDTSDWMFARVYLKSKDPAHVQTEYLAYMESVTAFFEKRTQEVLGRDIPQILLIHANQLNADTMPALLAMFKRRGYQFVTLDQALKDPAYQLEDGYTGRNGISWLHRWAAAKGLKPSYEPPEPKWLQEEFAR